MAGSVSKAARALGLVLVLVGLVLTLRWYISWLDRYFSLSPLSYYLPREFGLYLLAIVTSPVIPLVTVIEWMWHGWPQEPTLGFWCWLFGYALLLVGRRPPQGPEDVVGPEHE